MYRVIDENAKLIMKLPREHGDELTALEFAKTLISLDPDIWNNPKEIWIAGKGLEL
jgi:hypothetical protein